MEAIPNEVCKCWGIFLTVELEVWLVKDNHDGRTLCYLNRLHQRRQVSPEVSKLSFENERCVCLITIKYTFFLYQTSS